MPADITDAAAEPTTEQNGEIRGEGDATAAKQIIKPVSSDARTTSSSGSRAPEASDAWLWLAFCLLNARAACVLFLDAGSAQQRAAAARKEEPCI